jgi:TonB family protein
MLFLSFFHIVVSTFFPDFNVSSEFRLCRVSGIIIESDTIKPRFFSAQCESMKSIKSIERCAQKEMLTTFYSGLQYPLLAMENGIAGIVVLSFMVTKEGKISDLKIKKDIGGGCGEEALRCLKNLTGNNRKWIPATVDKIPIDYEYDLPIKFRLE